MEKDEVEKIEKALADLKDAKGAPDSTQQSIRTALDALNEASHDLARRIYEQASAGGGDAATGQQAGAATEADPVSAAEGDEPVVDANFTVKDD
jgi:hypothetical protein